MALVAYPDRPHMLLLGGPAVSTDLPVQPLSDVPDALRGRNDVKGRRHGPALLEIADPKFTPGELPFDIGAFLIGNHRVNPGAN